VAWKPNQASLPTYSGELNPFEKRVVEAESIYAELKLRTGCKYIRALNSTDDPRNHRNWRYFAGLVDLCDALGTTPREFLRCILWRTVDDMNRNREVLPQFLLTEWAIDRWKMFRHSLPSDENQDTFMTGLIGTLKVSRNFLRGRARGIFGDPDVPVNQLLNYHRQGSMQPEALRWIFSGALSRPYLALSAAFWGWHHQLPHDLLVEYVPPLSELQAERDDLLKNEKVLGSAREILGDDLYQPQTEEVKEAVQS